MYNCVDENGTGPVAFLMLSPTRTTEGAELRNFWARAQKKLYDLKRQRISRPKTKNIGQTHIFLVARAGSHGFISEHRTAS